MDSRTALPGVRNRASCGPTAGRGDRRASPAPRNRRFQRPSSRKPAQPMQIRPATASFPKSRLSQSFLRQAFSENSKGFVVVVKIRSKRTPKESAQLENRDASKECSRTPVAGPPPPPPPPPPGRAQRRALLHEELPKRNPGRAELFPPSQRRRGQEPKRPRQPQQQALSLPATLAPRGRNAPNCASRYLQRPPARPRSGETRRTEGRAHTRSKLEFRGELKILTKDARRTRPQGREVRLRALGALRGSPQLSSNLKGIF